MASYWKGDECIAITTDPCHKTKGLYVGNKYCITRLATFTNNKDAEDFEKFFEWFLGLREKEDGR